MYKKTTKLAIDMLRSETAIYFCIKKLILSNMALWVILINF